MTERIKLTDTEMKRAIRKVRRGHCAIWAYTVVLGYRPRRWHRAQLDTLLTWEERYNNNTLDADDVR